MFDADKTGMIGLPYGEKYDHMLSRFHLIPEHYGRTDGQTDGRHICYIKSRVIMLTRDKNSRVRPPNTHVEANSATVPTVLPSCEWK